jgi:hypothetical protein
VHRARALAPVVTVLLAAAALAGCKSQGPDRAMARFYGDTGARSEAMAASAAAAEQARTGGEAAEIVRDDADAPPQMAARPDPAEPPPKVDAQPERFIGLDDSALRAELGAPALVRREGPARVWQYRAAGCVLDLVLYPGDAGLSVRHLEARDAADAAPRDTAACLEPLLQRRAVAATG